VEHGRQPNLREGRGVPYTKRAARQPGAPPAPRQCVPTGAVASTLWRRSPEARVASRRGAARHAAAPQPRACKPSTSPHTTPPEPQRQISSMRMSSWKASKFCGAAGARVRAGAKRAALRQQPNRRGLRARCGAAARTRLGRGPRVRGGPRRPHHARQEARLERLDEELPRNRLCAVPRVAVRRHLRVHERAHLGAPRAVRRRVVRAARGGAA
jgi:hypothetical protein